VYDVENFTYLLTGDCRKTHWGADDRTEWSVKSTACEYN